MNRYFVLYRMRSGKYKLADQQAFTDLATAAALADGLAASREPIVVQVCYEAAKDEAAEATWSATAQAWERVSEQTKDLQEDLAVLKEALSTSEVVGPVGPARPVEVEVENAFDTLVAQGVDDSWQK